MSVLSDKQFKHSRMIALLILYIYERGYTVAISHCERCKDCPVGKEKSLHKSKLATDLDIFKDGKYLTKTKEYEFAGLFWEALGGTWGGRWEDGRHFSIAHLGRK